MAPAGPRRIQIVVCTLYVYTNSTSQTFNSLFRNFLGILKTIQGIIFAYKDETLPQIVLKLENKPTSQLFFSKEPKNKNTKNKYRQLAAK